MTCPSTYLDGTHTCRWADRNHYDLHRAEPGVWWSDKNADPTPDRRRTRDDKAVKA